MGTLRLNQGVCSQSLLPLRNCDECDQTTGTHWALFTAASLKHSSGQEAVVRPLVWHKWRHPSHTLVSLWSNGRKRLAWSLARYVQRCNTVCACAHVYQHNKALRPKDCEEICRVPHFCDLTSGLREISSNLTQTSTLTKEWTDQNVLVKGCRVFGNNSRLHILIMAKVSTNVLLNQMMNMWHFTFNRSEVSFTARSWCSAKHFPGHYSAP